MSEQRLTREARLQWLTKPPTGAGRVKVASGAFVAVPISLAQEEPNPGETTPGELLACAFAGYLGMHLALTMQAAGTALSELTVDVELSVSPWPQYITQEVEFSVLGRLCDPGSIAESAFAEQAAGALAKVAESLSLQADLARLTEARLL